jgi:hypothetical protein
VLAARLLRAWRKSIRKWVYSFLRSFRMDPSLALRRPASRALALAGRNDQSGVVFVACCRRRRRTRARGAAFLNRIAAMYILCRRRPVAGGAVLFSIFSVPLDCRCRSRCPDVTLFLSAARRFACVSGRAGGEVNCPFKEDKAGELPRHQLNQTMVKAERLAVQMRQLEEFLTGTNLKTERPRVFTPSSTQKYEQVLLLLQRCCLRKQMPCRLWFLEVADRALAAAAVCRFWSGFWSVWTTR